MVTRTRVDDKRRYENFCGGLSMARHNFREIVLILLAILGALGILLVIGSRLIHIAVGRATAGTGGIAASTGGVSVPLFSLVVVVLAIVAVLAVLLRRR